jgi:hypothetical protein
MQNDKDKAIKTKLKDVNIYTIDELKELLGLSTEKDAYTVDDLNKYIGTLSDKYPKLARDGFLSKALARLLENLDMNPDADPKTNKEPKELNKWWSNEYLEKDDENIFQKIKKTDRKDKVGFFKDGNGSHETMKRENLDVLNSHPLPIAQDSLNPTLKNINQRLVVIDSQFRPSISPSSSTDFTLDLSDPLTNTLSLKLYSYQIPYSWYVIDKTMGTSFFWVKYNGTTYQIVIEDGNYSKADLVNVIQNSLNVTLNNSTKPLSFNPLNISYNSFNGKACFLFATATPSATVEVIFYDTDTNNYMIDSITGSYFGANAMKINNNLGWILGFRPLDNDDTLPIIFSRPVLSTSNYIIPLLSSPYNLQNGVFSEGPIDTYGTRYLILVLDDFNQNHLNNGLVNIVDNDTTLSVPDYFSADLPNVCAPNPALGGVISPFYVQSLPRQLTQAQLYSINQILDNRKSTYKYRTSGPTTTDVFAIIPLKKQGLESGDTLIDLGSSLMYNTRTYFGPVNISRMRVSLQDDKGNVINMNGGDWSITIMAETLYQY